MILYVLIFLLVLVVKIFYQFPVFSFFLRYFWVWYYMIVFSFDLCLILIFMMSVVLFIYFFFCKWMILNNF